MNTDLLKQIKDEVAKDHEYIDFKHIFEPDHDHYSAIINEIAERYAAACVEKKENLILKLYHQCYDRATDYEILDDLKKILTDNGYPYVSED